MVRVINYITIPCFALYKYITTISGVAKVGNGWAQAQPIMSSAQPIFMSIVQPIHMHLPT